MPTRPTTSVIEHLRRAVLRDGAGLGDGELLGCFVERHDEAAFAALVKRHGALVWGVCRRLLSHHDAEDAFQATFLVLVRKAASIVPREHVANWLYGVAHQTALQARRTAARRRAREVQVAVLPNTPAVPPDQGADVQPLLDQELSRLPDIYRTVIVLCDLEGKTRKEVAGQLGCPEGTVAGRLARARALLAKRLAQRGIVLQGGALAVVLSQQAVLAGVPFSVVDAATKAASLFAAGKAAPGTLSVKVVALTEGVMKAMWFTKLKAAIAVLLMLGFVAAGMTMFTCRTAVGQEDQPPTAEKPVKAPQKQEQESLTAWGKEISGLQAGLGYRTGWQRVYGYGETVRLVLRIRNVSKKEVKFAYLQPFLEHAPSVTDGEGKPVPQPDVLKELGERLPGVVTLAPGEEIELHELKRVLRPASESGSKRFAPTYRLYGTGKVRVQYEQVLGNPALGRPGWQLDPVLSKLTTGKLELEIKSEPPPATVSFTAWGKEVHGLQAGLGYHPGQERTYYHGEAVKLVVRVRNVSKDVVKFEYSRQFFMENPPTVTDSAGYSVPFGRRMVSGEYHKPVEVTLAAGKEIELYEWKLELRPARESGKDRFSTLYGKGNFQIQYERVIGKSSAGPDLDPRLSKLATGTLALEISPDSPPAAIEKK